ncbi:MAG: ABC transporter ATP-binding protein [Fibrobacterota bacterium]
MNLSTRNLSAGYGNKTVVSGINIKISAGEVVCLLGANGSGKTTLFKALLGLIPMRGELLLNGKPHHEHTRKELACLMAYVPQTHIPSFPYTVLDMVIMGRTPYIDAYSVPSRKDGEESLRILGNLGIRHLQNRPYDELSGGERQLVLIARALAQAPRFLLMDEPTSHLDFGNQIRTLQLISRLAASGIGVIMTTHLPDHAFICATRVLALHQGKIVSEGAPREVIDSSLMKKMYDFDIDVIPRPSGRCLCAPVL